MTIPKNVTFHGAPYTFFGHSADAIENFYDILPFSGTRDKVLLLTDVNVEKTRHFKQFCHKCQSVFDCVVTLIVPGYEPTDQSINDAFSSHRSMNFDLVIGYGGGSVMDTAKIISLLLSGNSTLEDFYHNQILIQRSVRLALVPTTAGTGSEMSPVAVYKRRGEKVALFSANIRADFALIDPSLPMSCPRRTIESSGIDALVHAIESLISAKANFFSEMLSRVSVSVIFETLQNLFGSKPDTQTMYCLMKGILFSTVSFGYAGCGGIHALAYPLCGKTQVRHGEANAIMMLPVLSHNLRFSREKRYLLACALFASSAGDYSKETALSRILENLHALLQKTHLPRTLEEIGIRPQDLHMLAEQANTATILLSNNPVPLTEETIEHLYKRVYDTEFDPVEGSKYCE